MRTLLLRGLIEVAAAVALALLLRRFVCAFAFVKGRSMMDTLQNGDILFALRRGVDRRLRRFDVVLCHYPGREGLFVKRIVALPGERVSMAEGVLYIDSAPVAERFPLRSTQRALEERTMGAGEYFVMGDNRPCSRDSRSVGPIREAQILARAVCVVLPLRRIRKIDG